MIIFPQKIFFKRIVEKSIFRRSENVVIRSRQFLSLLLLKTSFFIIILLFSEFRLAAPDRKTLVVTDFAPVEPFRELVYAVGMVEGMCDTLAYNELEGAAGFFQIRQIRLDDYNKRTGSNYSLDDMFNYKKAERVFLYYASRIGPFNFEKIAKNWNGSGARTIEYWERVKEYL